MINWKLPPIEEVNMLTERLIDAWGSLLIMCANGNCTVYRGMNVNEVVGPGPRIFEAPTLLDALRLAVGSLENA